MKVKNIRQDSSDLTLEQIKIISMREFEKMEKISANIPEPVDMRSGNMEKIKRGKYDEDDDTNKA